MLALADSGGGHRDASPVAAGQVELGPDQAEAVTFAVETPLSICTADRTQPYGEMIVASGRPCWLQGQISWRISPPRTDHRRCAGQLP